MRRLVAVELFVLRTTPVSLGFVAGFVLVQLVGLVWSITGGSGAAGDVVGVLGSGVLGAMVVLAHGTVLVTGEHRHRTITGTVLAVPARTSVLVAKAVAIAVVGLAVAVLSVGVAVGVGLPSGWLDLGAVDAGVVRAVALLLLALPLYGLLGVGFGAVLVNQTAAVVVPLLWFLAGEAVVVAVGPPWLQAWTPGGASSALGYGLPPSGLLPAWGGALLLLAYATALLVVGAVRFERSDLT